MTCSLESQIEINTDETSPKISWGMKEHLHVQIGYAHTDIPSALIHNHNDHMVDYNKSKGEFDVTCSLDNVLSVQSFDNLKNLSKPTTSRGMDVHLHVQSGYAHTDLPSTLLQSRSDHLIYYNKSKGKGAHQFQEGAQPFQEGAHQFQEGAPEQDAPPNYEEAFGSSA